MSVQSGERKCVGVIVCVRHVITELPLPGILHSMSPSSLAAALPIDGRQSPTALKIARGTTRLLHSLGFSVVSELSLASGRRADLVALGANGDLWIVEIKSSVADFRADQKWMDYRAHCDRLFFATTLDVPCEIFPPDTGLIVADAYGASIRLRGARASPARLDPQEHDARLRARRGAAALGARRSGRAVWQRILALRRDGAAARSLARP